MARAVARQLDRQRPIDGPTTASRAPTSAPSSSCSASTWPASATPTPPTAGAHDLVWDDPRADVYKKLVVVADGDRVLGAVLVGDASAYGTRSCSGRGDLPRPAHPEALILPDLGPPRRPAPRSGSGRPTRHRLLVRERHQGRALRGGRRRRRTTVGDLKAATRAGTGCGGCVPLVTTCCATSWPRPASSSSAACASTSTSAARSCSTWSGSQRLRARSPRCWPRHGAGPRAARCASRRSRRSWPRRTTATSSTASRPPSRTPTTTSSPTCSADGTYSVVPRIPGGEITPEKLIVIGEVARDFGLYTKITGGQRIDLFGARVEQLPADLAPARRRRLRVAATPTASRCAR